MFEFAWPWLALLLPLPVLVWRLSRPAAAAEPHFRYSTAGPGKGVANE